MTIKKLSQLAAVAGISAAAAVSLVSSLPAQASAPVAVSAPAASAPGTCVPYILGRFTWRRPGYPGYPYGLSRFNVFTNRCRNTTEAIIACVYVGPRAAQLTVVDIGNAVVFGVTQVRCAPRLATPGWTFNHARGAGFRWYNGRWHDQFLVS